MDRSLYEFVWRGDVPALLDIIERDESAITQTVRGSLNTPLHLAARFGHLEFAKEIVRARAESILAENAELETALHEACREGHVDIVDFFLEIDPTVVCKVSSREQTVLFAACERNRVEVVKRLLDFPRLLMLETDMATSSLHVAASSGNAEIVKEILKARPDFAWKKDLQLGWTPLHVACSKGHLEITRELTRLDSDLCSIRDNEGRTPLHCAAIKGRVNIVDEILCLSLDSAQTTTFNGETVLHLAVKNNQYDTVKYLTESLNTTKLVNVQDNDGNTVLHLAIAGKLTAMVTYLLKIGTDVNSLNGEGYTALDVAEDDATNSGVLAIVPALLEAGAKRCDQLPPGGSKKDSPPQMMNNSTSKQYRTLDHPSGRARHRRAKRLEFQNEGLRNARKTIIIVAVLIATVSFTAGLTPPGGFDQETGKALRGDRAAFKVFLVCDVAALFLSIGVVNVLVSIVPFTRRTMMWLLTVTHKVMWLSTMFMMAAYVAGVWTILPENREGRWVSVGVVVIGGGCSIVVFIGLGFLLTRHWLDKHEWRKAKRRRMEEESPKSSVSRIDELRMRRRSQDHRYSSNSDVDSSDHGYHLY